MALKCGRKSETVGELVRRISAEAAEGGTVIDQNTRATLLWSFQWLKFDKNTAYTASLASLEHKRKISISRPKFGLNGTQAHGAPFSLQALSGRWPDQL